jgi:RNA polymerase sigma-70 factor (ECF subfamily)
VALYEQHYEQVLAYARRRLPEEAARDAAAETFLTAWRRWEVASTGGLPWLFATAALVVRAAHRTQGRRGALLGRLAAQPPHEVGSDHAADLAERDAVLGVVRALSPRDREVLLLTVWEGLDVRTAARVLGTTVGAAHVRLHRARRRLRALLEAQGLAPPALERGGRAATPAQVTDWDAAPDPPSHRVPQEVTR